MHHTGHLSRDECGLAARLGARFLEGPSRDPTRPQESIPCPDRRYTMAKPFWRQLLDSPRFMRAAFGMVLFSVDHPAHGRGPRCVGPADDDVGPFRSHLGERSRFRSPIPWLVIGAGVLVQVSHLGDFTGGVQLGIWLAFAIVAFGALWQSGTIRTRRTVRLRGVERQPRRSHLHRGHAARQGRRPAGRDHLPAV